METFEFSSLLHLIARKQWNRKMFPRLLIGRLFHSVFILTSNWLRWELSGPLIGLISNFNQWGNIKLWEGGYFFMTFLFVDLLIDWFILFSLFEMLAGKMKNQICMLETQYRNIILIYSFLQFSINIRS